MAEAEPLSPRKTALVLVIVGGCFAVLWPRLLQPALMGAPHDPLAPNRADRAQGCCDVIFETDVNAIKIMTELCGNILQRKNGPLDPRTATAFASGKLPMDIIATCRREVDATCGVDISAFLQQNVKLGKSYRQILEEVRSYNSSACLKMHFGVPTWELGAHVIPKAWGLQQSPDNIKQERPVHGRDAAPHPALRERGRAVPETRAPPRAAPAPTRAPGRVRSPLSVYYEQEAEPPPVPGVRPPLGGAGGALPPPKSSVGFVMPLYTICIVVFFLYTLCKILFKRTDGTGGSYEPIHSDPMFRRHVFDEARRLTPEPKIVVSAISGLVAEVRQQMEASYAQSDRADSAQGSQEDTTRPYTNGTVRSASDASPVRIIAKEYKDPTPEPAIREIVPELTVETPKPRDETLEPEEKTIEFKENTPEFEVEKLELNKITVKPEQESFEPREQTSEPKNLSLEPINERTSTPEEKQSTPELLADALLEDSPKRDNGVESIDNNNTGHKEEKEDGLQEELSEEELDYDEDEEEEESPVVRQLRASVENDTATVKHEAPEVSSIFLEGDIPQQSRLLVADSATRADQQLSGKDSPVILSGKMTLSLINDVAKETPERDLESPTTLDDDDFTTASAVTQPKQNTQEEELSEEEVEEEVEEEMEVEEIEEEVEEEPKKSPQDEVDIDEIEKELEVDEIEEELEVDEIEKEVDEKPKISLHEEVAEVEKEPKRLPLEETEEEPKRSPREEELVEEIHEEVEEELKRLLPEEDEIEEIEEDMEEVEVEEIEDEVEEEPKQSLQEEVEKNKLPTAPSVNN